MGHLDALGASGGAAGVVDGGRDPLVRLPRRRLEVPAAEQLVGLGPDHELLRRGDRLELLGELGVDQQHLGAAVADDVVDLVGMQAEVDRHRDAPVGGRAVEHAEQARRVLRHDRDAAAGAHAKRLQPGGEGPGAARDVPVGQLAERRRWLVGLVDDADPVAVDERCAVEVVPDGERYLHLSPCGAVRSEASLAHDDGPQFSGRRERRSGPGPWPFGAGGCWPA